MHNIIIIYSLLSFFSIFFAGVIAYKFNLVDLPHKRKIHTKPTAYTGGIAISLALAISIIIFDFTDNSFNVIISIAFLISLVGLIDDIFNLNVGGKLSLQIIPIFYIVIQENLNLNHLGNYDYFKFELGSFSIIFTLFCVLFLINSFNYFDGLDGTLSFASISVLSILYFIYPDQNFRFFLIIISIPIFIFILFNFAIFKLQKIFLGDSGSLLIGFIISFILIYLGSNNLIHPILLAWVIVIFVYEFLSINFIRLKIKKNPFKAGQDHLHHLLFKKTKSILVTNLFICLSNLILFMLGYFSFLLISPLASLVLYILLFILYLILRERYSIKYLKI